MARKQKQQAPKQPEIPEADRVRAILYKDKVVTEDSDEARVFYSQSCFGKVQSKRVHLPFIEALYLLEKEKLVIVDSSGKKVTEEAFLKKAQKLYPKFWTQYQVFKDIRDRGYIIKTALKFGADFRVYDRGVRPGADHAKWVIFPVNEGEPFTWYEFAAKNRVAHSTKKRLLIAIVDGEGDVTYYEIQWMRP